jgi:hypothetical protein
MTTIVIIYFIILLFAVRYAMKVFFDFEFSLQNLWNKIDSTIQDIILPPSLYKTEMPSEISQEPPISGTPISGTPISGVPIIPKLFM